jgi:hypothetical protein
MLKRGLVRLITQDRLSSNKILVTRAKMRPNCRTFSRISRGSLLAMTLMKIMLSIPRMISRAESVKKATQALGSLISCKRLSIDFYF